MKLNEDDISELLMALAGKAKHLFDKLWADSVPPGETRTIYTRAREGSYEEHVNTRLTGLHQIEGRLRQTDEYRETRDLLSAHHVLSGPSGTCLVRTITHSRQVSVDDLIDWSILSLIKGPEENSQSLSHKIVRDLDEMLNGHYVTADVWVALNGVDYDGAPQQILPGIQLFPLGESMKLRLLNRQMRFQERQLGTTLNPFQPLHTGALLISHIAQKSEVVRREDEETCQPLAPPDIPVSSFSHAIGALRIILRQTVVPSPIFIDDNSPFVGASSIQYPWGLHAGPISGGLTKLDAQLVERARDVAADLAAMEDSKTPGLSVALNRLDSYSYRLTSADRLIDSIIAIEAIASKIALDSNSNQEMSFRYSLAAAYYMGETSTERKQIFDDLRAGFKQRGSLVHGCESKDPDKSVVEQVHQVLCQLTTKYLKDVRAQRIPKLASLLFQET